MRPGAHPGLPSWQALHRAEQLSLVRLPTAMLVEGSRAVMVSPRSGRRCTGTVMSTLSEPTTRIGGAAVVLTELQTSKACEDTGLPHRRRQRAAVAMASRCSLCNRNAEIACYIDARLTH